ncbi:MULTISPECIES: filamentous hemagglutinin N-terminal domain-containing protein [unclassified Moorena]|uniref:two-partner secretion domain-containing protein n=1 Tax=unclassified Moorena TaxID=2683338 RepID=UPI0014007044|nr:MULTISPECIES: filamentous hemagglutinin N-terminal domain-containing protein [unclassified Moorena]NEQ02296.1 filamentous hemagglutinin N-terminal domain-containing protein [Moorena sp. SIO3F7]
MKPRISRLVPASSVVLYSLLAATTALGQITPDNTLGDESSVVTNLNINGIVIDLIEGGAIRDSNLFHSFSDFNVAEFGRVYFANPAGVANILSRVTGGNVSNILGTLGVLGNANLFVINPNGIVFGPNSRLDVGGSFFGSTADSVLFDDGTVFSTKNPNEKPLLTINIPSGLQYGSNPGSITNQSFFGLRVPNGQTLGLIGGEVTIPNGALFALDGRIELGGVGANGVVNLTPTDTSFVLDYSGVQGFQDISLSEFAFVNTSGESGGSIQVRGANVSLRDRSFVFADTLGNQNGGGIVVEASQLSLEGGSRITATVFGSGQGGDLTVDASESVRMVGVSADGTPSALAAQVFPEVTGNGGDISITTGELMLKDGALVSASTFGEGDGGNLTVNADSTVQLIGHSANNRFFSGLFTQTFGTGNAGDLNITTGKLIVSDGASVSASTSGEGNGGNLSVDASYRVQVIGTTADGNFPSALSTQTNPGSTGNGGNLSITTGQLMVSDGAVVSVNTFGEGDGGNLSVNASSTVQVIGTSADGLFSGLFARTEGKGNGGDISITTSQLMASDGAVVSADTFGEGNGGNLSVNASSTVQVIGTSADGLFHSALSAGTEGKGNGGDVSITTGQLTVSEGAVVSVSTFGEGDSGNLSVNASSTVKLSSDLFAQANRGSKGNAGNLSITTRQLIVKDGAQVSTGTFGEGDSGDLTVNASSTVQLIGTGTSADGQFASGLFTRTLGIGNAGELNITTGQLMVSEGAVVSASTFGEGDGGDLTVNANSTVKVIGTSADGRLVSGLSTQANSRATGNAGDLTIATGELIVSDGAQVSAGTSGEGDGGDLTVNASESVQLSSDLSTQTQGTGNAGDLTIATGELIVSDGAQVSASTLGEGDGGNLSVNASESVQLIGTGTSADGEFASGLFIRANREATGNAGKFLNITTDKLIISDGAEVSARSFEERTSAGEVNINANSIFLDNNGIITAQTAGGDKSKIRLEAGDIRLLNESKIITDAQNTTIGGNIFINTDTLVGLGNSDITANADQGPGGRVEINAKGIFGLEFRDDLTPDNDITSTSKRGSSFNGDVILNISQVDPTSGLNELPGILVDAEAILANDLCGFENDRIAGGSSFIITGKGGLPPTPEDPVINAHRTVRWRTRPRLPSTRQPLQAQPSVKPRQDKKVIIEAQGWVVAKDGTIILTAQPFQGTPVEQIFPNLDCHAGRGNREQGTGNRE